MDQAISDEALEQIRQMTGEIENLRYGLAEEQAMHALTIQQVEHYRSQLVKRTAALEEIRTHWANQYDHPRKENEMYRGSYGIGVTDGHRACTIIAERALTDEPTP